MKNSGQIIRGPRLCPVWAHRTGSAGFSRGSVWAPRTRFIWDLPMVLCVIVPGFSVMVPGSAGFSPGFCFSVPGSGGFSPAFCVGFSYQVPWILPRVLGVSSYQWWNELPAALRTAESLTIFRKGLKTHLFRVHLDSA
ncbi:unnamed protein product [Arctogadus glacialis]